MALPVVRGSRPSVRVGRIGWGGVEVGSGWEWEGAGLGWRSCGEGMSAAWALMEVGGRLGGCGDGGRRLAPGRLTKLV